MSISAISLGLILFFVFVIVVGVYKIHSLPGDIARRRNHPQAQAITVCSVMGLLVFPLWMAALVWAYAGVVGAPLAQAPAPPEGAAAPVDRSEPDGDDGATGRQG